MRKLYVFGLVGLAAIIIGLAWADQMTFTTYYPAPHGVYRNFEVTENANFATRLGAFDKPIGRVGIGTTEPSEVLEVNGKVRIGDRIDGYTLPDTDGEDGQALETNGSGDVTWQNVPGPQAASGRWSGDIAGRTSFNIDADTGLSNVTAAIASGYLLTPNPLAAVIESISYNTPSPGHVRIVVNAEDFGGTYPHYIYWLAVGN